MRDRGEDRQADYKLCCLEARSVRVLEKSLTDSSLPSTLYQNASKPVSYTHLSVRQARDNRIGGRRSAVRLVLLCNTVLERRYNAGAFLRPKEKKITNWSAGASNL